MTAGAPAGVILAAGKGTRMRSATPKGLHTLCGLSILQHVVRAFNGAGVERPVVVIGHGADEIRDHLGSHATYAVQHEQLGTGHAALMAKEALADHDGSVFVTPGDTPLMTSGGLRSLADRQSATGAVMVLATCELPDPTGYGRIIRDDKGRPTEIVEEADCTDQQRAMREVNPSMYCFDARFLFDALDKIGDSNEQGERYLTDLLEVAVDAGQSVEAVPFSDPRELLGINDRWQLAEATAIMRERILKRHALAGVGIVDPSTTYIDAEVELAEDVRIEPMTSIEGRTFVGSSSVIGPNSRVVDSNIGSDCLIHMSHVNRADIKDEVRVGPYANIRPHSTVGRGAKVGNFVEIKASDIGEWAAISHLAYVGDATVGDNANIGAGTITCNYDGAKKSRTVIGRDAFVGSNSTLVAPVKIGDDAFVAAGSIVTDDVPDGSLAIGRARQENKAEWVKRWRQQNQSKES